MRYYCYWRFGFEYTTWMSIKTNVRIFSLLGHIAMYRSRSGFFFFWNKWVVRWRRGGAMCQSMSPKDRYPSWIPVPHLCCARTRCQRTSAHNGHKKDMCRLESFSNRIGRSPWVLKAALFFKSFLLRSTHRAYKQHTITISIIIPTYQQHKVWNSFNKCMEIDVQITYEKLNDDDLHWRSPSLSAMSYHSPNLVGK